MSFCAESTEGKLKDRGVYDALQAEMPYYRAEHASSVLIATA